MKLQLLCLFLAFTFFTSLASPAERVPDEFASNYYVKGVLLLPYAEINEPFQAFFDKDSSKSRIDYYGDTVITYQRADKGDYGTSYKLAFMPDENGTPQRTCFEVDGNEKTPVTIQSILPDLTGFQYIKDSSCFAENSLISGELQEMMCEMWQSENQVDDKKNTYTMYLHKDTKAPIHYIMKGYNTLLGSHYDKYELYYMNYTVGSATDDDFEISDGIQCRSFPGPGVQEMVLMNPMREYIGREDNHIQEKFEDFKRTHNKAYPDDNEHEIRKSIFRQNHRYIESMNRQGLTFGLKINHFADFTDSELHRIRGRLPSSGVYNGGQAFPAHEFTARIPDSLDWRLVGAVTPVKDQAVCGSCWSFGTTGTIEGAYFLKTNHLVRLSQQQLIDCSWRYQNNGCDGGEDFRAYAYIMAAGGLATEDDYGQYMGEDGICHDTNVTKTAQITGFVNVTSGDIEALRQAIAKKGPISVGIDAAHKSFSFYSHGVYYDPDCKSGENELDHSVLAVGYGVMNDKPYWIVKNSWSTYWGNDGYVLMSQKDNNCGVATSPTYVIM